MWKLPATWHESVPFVAQVGLFLTLAVLAIRWVVATHHEFHLWKGWLLNPLPRAEVFAAIVVLSLTLGGSLAYSYNIVLITFIFTVYLLLNYWTQWLSNDHFARALPATKKEFQSEAQRAVLKVLGDYWLKQPQLARITTMMFLSSVAFSIALAGYLQKEPQKHLFQLTANILLIITILGGEIVIACWRHQRDQDITKAMEGKLAANFDPPSDEADEDDKVDLKNFSILGYSLIFGVALGWVTIIALIVTLRDTVKSSRFLFPVTWDSQPLLILSVLFCAELLALCIFWIVATKNELRIWIKWLKNPVGKVQVSFAIIGLAFVLGTALAFFYSIVFISAFLTLYLLVNYWTQWISNDHFNRALQRTRKGSLTKTRSKILSIMEVYWVDRPQMARITTLMFFASIGFSLAFAGFFQEEPLRDRFYLASYCVLFVDILVGEIVIHWWRHKRDRDIAQAQQPKE